MELKIIVKPIMFLVALLVCGLVLFPIQARALVYYDFDNDNEVGGSNGWRIEEWQDDGTPDPVPTLSRDTTSGNGLPETGSLKISCATTASEYYKFYVKDYDLVDNQDVRRLPYYRVAIKTPNVSDQIKVKLSVKSSSDSWELHQATQVTLTNNAWNLLSYDLSSLSSSVLADIDEWAIEFELPTGLTGDIYVDTVEINYINNSSFEKAGSSTDFEGWTEWDSDSDLTYGSQSSTYARTGTYSAKITVNNSSGWHHGFYQDMPAGSVTAGDVIFASVYIYSPSTGGLTDFANAFLKIEWKDSNGSDLGGTVESTHLTGTNTNDQWVEYTVQGTAPANCSYARIALTVANQGGGGTGDVYFDDPYIHRPQTLNLTEGSCTLSNAGFEKAGATDDFESWGQWGNEGSRVTGFSRSGNASLKIIANGAAGSNTGYWQDAYSGTTLVEGARVTASAYIYCSTDDAPTNGEYGIIKVEIRDSTGTYNRSTETTLTTSNSDWTRYKVETTVTATDVTNNASVIRVICQTYEPNAGATATFYFDDVNVYYEEAPPITIRNVPDLSDAGYTSSPGMEMEFESTRGGMITSYYDYSAGKGTQQIVSGGTWEDKLFKFKWYKPVGNWYGLDQEKEADFTLLENTSTRVRFKIESKHWTGDKIVTNYTIYPNKTFYIRSDFTVLSYSNGYGGQWVASPSSDPGTLWVGFHQDYDGYQTNFYIDDDANTVGALLPDAEGHDGALILHHDLSDFDTINAGSNDVASGGDRIYIEYQPDAAVPDSFLYNTTETHYWLLDLSESFYDTTLLTNKREDYRLTHSNYITMNTGALLSGSNAINDDADQDGFDEATGTWNLQCSENKVSFEIESGATYERYAPVFFITDYKDSAATASSNYIENSKPSKFYQGTTLLTEGESYNIDFINFSEVWSGAADSTTDITSNCNDVSSDSTLFSNQNDYLYVGSPYKFQGILVDLDTNASATINPAWAYWTEPVKDDCESSSDWTADTNVTLSDDTDKKVGTYSMKIAVADAYTTGNIAYSDTPNNEDWSGYSGVVFWIKTTVASEDMDGENNSDLRFVVSNADGLATEDAVYDLPPIPANTWTEVHLKMDLSSCTSVDSFGIKLREDNGAQDIYIDDIKTGYWKNLTVTDGTSGFTSDGMIYFDEPTDWATVQSAQDITGMNGLGLAAIIPDDFYYVRIKRQASTLTTPPVENKIVSNLLVLQYFGKIDTDNFLLGMAGVTAVSLTDFSAIGYFGKVKLNWKTEAEYKNAGFNIYRHEEGQEGYIKINDELIKGLNTTSMGGEYTFVDIEVEDGKTYWYLLEDVETTGKKTTHGPIVVHPGLDTDSDGITDDWEYYYGLDPTVDDAGLDGDNDGLTNIEEFLAGTNPNIIDAEEAQTNQDAIKLTYLASGAVELELDTSQFTETQKTIEGITYQIITIPDYNHAQNDEVGKPLVPVKSILLGVEAKKDLKVELLEAQKESFSNYLLYPVERVILTTNANDDTIKQLTQEFYKDEGAYAQDTFYPGKLYDVDYSGYLRDQMIAKVMFYPIQFNPVTGELNFYKKIKLKVTLPESEEKFIALNDKILPFTGRENYKIYIDENGIYKITGADLQTAGVDLSQINVNSIGIYHKSTQIPIKSFGLDDGYFDTGDYIEFYAQAIDTKYTGENVYWLNFTSLPLLITQSAGYEGSAPVSESFLRKVHFEENKLYWNWQEEMGEDHWFYSFILRAPGSRDVNFNIETLADINADATLKIALQGISYYGDEPPHHIYFHLNGNFIGEASWQGNDLYKAELNFSNLFLNEGVNTLRIELPGDIGWNYEKVMLDWIEVSYYSTYQATDDKITFSHTQSEPANFQLTGFSTDDIAIFDITNPDNPKEISDYEVINEDTTYTISFKDSGMKDYIATSSLSLKTPKKIVMDEPSDLRSTQNKADYIIITAKEFYDTIQTFANYRAQKGLKVIVVKVQDIYDEFNYGIFDPQAIKDFLKYAYYNWKKPAPTYVLLVGDASFDYRNYYGFGDLNYVPTYMVSTTNFSETGSDNWFVCFDGEEDIAPEMLIGRFPIKTTEQLEVIINKIKDYEALDADMDWTKKVLLVADDNEEIFTDISDNLITYLTDKYTAEQLYLSHYIGSIAEFKDKLISEINNGSLILNYTGHGANQLWADERILTNSDLSLLYNTPYLPLVTMYTCLSGYFVYPKYYESLGEEFLYQDGGGAVAVIAPSGLTLPSSQQYLAEGIFRQFFLNKDAIVGSLFTQAKLYLLENASSDDAINVIQIYNLFGDPALSLKKETLTLMPDIAPPKVYTTSSTTSSSDIVALTNISGGSDTNVQIDETSSLSGVKKTVAERAEKKEEVQERIKLSRGTKGIIRSKAFSQPSEIKTEASLQKSQGSGQTQSARKTEGIRHEQIIIKQKPPAPKMRLRPTKEIIRNRNIKRLYKLVKQKNQKITILVSNYRNALKSKDYKEARFRIKLISRILKEKE